MLNNKVYITQKIQNSVIILIMYLLIILDATMHQLSIDLKYYKKVFIKFLSKHFAGQKVVIVRKKIFFM